MKKLYNCCTQTYFKHLKGSDMSLTTKSTSRWQLQVNYNVLKCIILKICQWAFEIFFRKAVIIGKIDRNINELRCCLWLIKKWKYFISSKWFWIKKYSSLPERILINVQRTIKSLFLIVIYNIINNKYNNMSFNLITKKTFFTKTWPNVLLHQYLAKYNQILWLKYIKP